MKEIKKIFNKKILIAILPIVPIIVVLFIIIVVIMGLATGESLVQNQVNNMRVKSFVNNNQLYAPKYKQLLNKYLSSKGYVTLERLVFYLQRTNNILDVSTLSDNLWEEAYLANVNEEEKQMITIKTLCKNLNENETLPNFDIVDGFTNLGVTLDVINLCYQDNVDISTSDDYEEYYYPLPFQFPLKRKFTITSMVFEHRYITNLGESFEDIHNGWDIGVPVGTDFYSVCDGTVTDIVNTQDNDLSYNESNNPVGNFMIVKCTNNLSVLYWHIQYRSQPDGIIEDTEVKKGDLLGRTSTTGKSTGPHLHLGLRTEENDFLDIMAYIDFTKYEEN